MITRYADDVDAEARVQGASSRRAKMIGVVASVIAVVSMIAPGSAEAVSTRVKFACAKDFYTHCKSFGPNSPEARMCMRAAGERLSPRCVSALIAAGEVSAAEVAQRAEAAGRNRQ